MLLAFIGIPGRSSYFSPMNYGSLQSRSQTSDKGLKMASGFNMFNFVIQELDMTFLHPPAFVGPGKFARWILRSKKYVWKHVAVNVWI